MNINGFFLLILACLIIIYVAFEPLDIEKQNHGEIPMFELNSFTIHEFTPKGLVTIMQGSEGWRFKDHYKVNDINYTDNSKDLTANIKAKRGTYRDEGEALDLNKNVVYKREDGLVFKTQKLLYSQVTSIAKTDKPYVMYINEHKIIGSSLVYNSKLKRIKSKNIIVKYQIKEEKR